MMFKKFYYFIFQKKFPENVIFLMNCAFNFLTDIFFTNFAFVFYIALYVLFYCDFKITEEFEVLPLSLMSYIFLVLDVLLNLDYSIIGRDILIAVFDVDHDKKEMNRFLSVILNFLLLDVLMFFIFYAVQIEVELVMTSLFNKLPASREDVVNLTLCSTSLIVMYQSIISLIRNALNNSKKGKDQICLKSTSSKIVLKFRRLFFI